jgi:oxygen-dependent protoporphyrinogen oxidase
MMDELGLELLPIPGLKTAIAFEDKVYLSARVESYGVRLPLTLRERLALGRTGLKVMRAVRGYHGTSEARSGESEYERRARVARYMSDISFGEYLGQLPPRVDVIFRCAGRRAASELEEHSAGVGASLFASVWGGKKAFATLNLKGGSSMLPLAVGRALGKRVMYGAEVIEVKPVGDRVRVRYRDAQGGGEIVARQVIVAVPAFVALRVVGDLPADVATTLANVTYGPFVSMAVLTTERGRMPWDGIYALTTPGLAFNMFFNHANPLRDDGARKAGGSLMVYAGGASARALLEESDAEIERRFRVDLCRIYPELRDSIAETIVQRWEIGNTFRRPGMSFDAMLEYSSREGNMVHFAGDYFVELGNVEFAAGTGVQAAARVRRELEVVAAGRPA